VRSLTLKMVGALLLVAIVAVGLMAYLMNMSTSREFRQYLSGSNMMYTQNVATSLSQFYSREQSWAVVQGTLPSLLRSHMGDAIMVCCPPI